MPRAPKTMASMTWIDLCTKVLRRDATILKAIEASEKDCTSDLMKKAGVFYRKALGKPEKTAAQKAAEKKAKLEAKKNREAKKAELAAMSLEERAAYEAKKAAAKARRAKKLAAEAASKKKAKK